MTVCVLQHNLLALLCGCRVAKRNLGVKGVLGIFLDEGDEVLERTVTVVVNEVASASGLELERREAGDAEGHAWGEIVLGRLHLGTVVNATLGMTTTIIRDIRTS